MIPLTTLVDWRESARIVPSRYPPIGVFDRVADSGDLEAVIAIEGLTNDRLRDQAGEICLVPEAERIFGPGTTPIMAAFTHPNTDGSRFSNGSFGVYYAGDSLATAIAESRFHRQRFLAYSSEPPIRLEMRTYYATIRGELHDLRTTTSANSHWFDPDPDRYDTSQNLGFELKSKGSNGVIYASVGRAEGECVGIFRPRLVSPVTQGPHFEYIWDGRSIVDVLQVKRFSETDTSNRKH